MAKFNNTAIGNERTLQNIGSSTIDKLQITVTRTDINDESIVTEISPNLHQIVEIGRIQENLIIPGRTNDSLHASVINLQLMTLVAESHRLGIADIHG